MSTSLPPCDQVHDVEALAQLARLGVAEPHAVADPQPGGRPAEQRRLDLARALARVELEAARGAPGAAAGRAPAAPRGDVAAAERGRELRRRLAHDRQHEERRRARAGTRGRCRTASARTGPEPAATSVTAGSAAVRSIEPVPPPLTNRSGATERTASTISARRRASSRADSACSTGSASRISGLPGRPVADAGDLALVGHQPVEHDVLAREPISRAKTATCTGSCSGERFGPRVIRPPTRQPASTSMQTFTGPVGLGGGDQRPGARRQSTITVTRSRAGPRPSSRSATRSTVG